MVSVLRIATLPLNGNASLIGIVTLAIDVKCVSEKQVEVRECLLLVSAESSIFQLVVQGFKDQAI
jgi:hypothetical protein